MDDVQHVANRGASGRSDQANALRIARQRPFAFRGEETFRMELLLELLESGLQCAKPFQLDGGDPQLILAARFIDGDFAFHHDFAAILQETAVHLQFATKQDAA